MNAGILTPPTQFATMPRGLLGRPTPVPMIDARRVFDPDAQRYLAAVEAADGRPLEEAVRVAIGEFVIGCKEDGVWDAIRASCILMGARTVSGALVPLAGPAPTNINFATGDYLRGGATPGFRGNATNKAINSNHRGDADPQDDCHGFVWNSQTPATGSLSIMFAQAWSNNFQRFMFWNGGNGGFANGSTGDAGVYANGGSQIHAQRFSGAWAVSRSNPSSFLRTTGGSLGVTVANSVAPITAAGFTNLQIFRAPVTPTAFVWGNTRICFYSFGRSLSIPLLRARVSALVSSIAEAV